MKRVITCFLTVVLLLGTCLFAVSAAGTGSLSVTGAEGKQGDTVTVTVKLSSNPGLITMKFAVSYPSDLELTKVENSGLLGGWTTPAPTISSPYTIRWADSLATTNNTATGKLVTLTFKIKDSATPGSKTVSVTFNESRDAEGGKNTFGNASATIKVNCKSHSYGSYTSTGNAQHSRTCSACGHTEKANHSWNSGTVTKPATCKEAGEKKLTCTICNATKTEAIAKLTTHSYGKWSKVNDTAHKHTCSVCQKEETANHGWDSGKITKQPDCKNTGIKTYTCTGCNATKTEDIAKTTSHKYGSWTKVSDTTHKRTCTVCQKEETASHSWNGGTVTKKATCKEAGEKTYTCTACGAVKKEPVAKLTTHTYDNTCDTDCNVCGATRTVTHKYKNKWSNNKTSHWYECSVCKQKKDEAKHTPGPKATEKKAQKCTVCDYVITPKLSHKHDYASKWTTNEEGHWHKCDSCEEKGKYAAHDFDNACDPDCSVCGYTRESAHTYEETWVNDEVNHWQVCAGCGEKTEEAAHIPGEEATETTAQKCTICDYEIAPALVGETTEPTETVQGVTPVKPDAPAEESFPWWIIIVAVVVIGGGITAFVLIKKKNH